MGDEPDSTFEREREIFFAALEKKTEGSRTRYLEETCGGDGAMLARVREMLKQHHTEDSDTFLVSPAIVDEIARLLARRLRVHGMCMARACAARLRV